MLNAIARPYVRTALAMCLTATLQPAGRAQEPSSSPFEFLAPSIVVSAQDRARLDRGEVLARTLSGHDGQMAIFVATRLDAQPDALVTWMRAIAELKRSRFVLAIGRFSDPPAVSDLDALTLDQRDLDAIRRCRAGNCGMKLSAAEIGSLTAVVAAAGTEWGDAAQCEFRRLLVERVKQYRAGGLAALQPPADRRKPKELESVLSAIIGQSPYLTRLPAVVAWLKAYPRADPAVESFLYWSKENYGKGKSVVSVTHVGILRAGLNARVPPVIVVGKQIFATHYVEGSLGLTMVVRDAGSGTPYLLYVNRSQVDLLRGFFGALVRGMVEERVERQAPQIIQGLRGRLESGAPPGGGMR